MSKEEEIEEKEANIEYLINKSTQNFKDINLDENLTPIQKADIRDILSKFQNPLKQIYQAELMFWNMISDSLIQNLLKYTFILLPLEPKMQLRKKLKLC